MGKFRHLSIPCLAAVVGLLLGFVGPTLSGSADGEADSPDQQTTPARDRPGMAHPVPRSVGPTLRLLREVADFSADECEEFAREHLGSAGKEIELEAVFRRWLARSSAEEILEKMAQIEGAARSTAWETTFFRAWVAMDEGRAMEPVKDRFGRTRLLFAIEFGVPSFPVYYDKASSLFRTDEGLIEALTRLARDRPEIARVIQNAEIPDDRKLPNTSGFSMPAHGSLRKTCIAAVAHGWATTEPEAAWNWVSSLGFDEHHEAVPKVLAEWVKTDPEAARAAMEADGIDEVAISRDRELAIFTRPNHAQSHFSLALTRDPFIDAAGLHALLLEADIDWENGTHVTPPINQPGWYPVDPEAAARQAERLPAGSERNLIMQAIADNWIAHDREQALAFAKKHGIESRPISEAKKAPPEATRQAALADPERTFAALFDLELQPIDGINHKQLQALAQEWAEADPVAASEWLVTQPVMSDSQRSSLVHNTMGYYWARQDPLGASRWMESLADGPLRSKVWSAIQEEVTRYAPDLAFELTAVHTDGSYREHHLKNQLDAVAKSIGRPAAVELLSSPDLSIAERSALAESLRDEP